MLLGRYLRNLCYSFLMVMLIISANYAHADTNNEKTNDVKHEAAIKKNDDEDKINYKDLMLFGDVFEKIRKLYVNKPVDRELIENALQGMLTALDPHSSYMNEKDTEEFNASTFGSFGGIGIEVTLEDGYVKVIAPIAGGVAEKSGVRAGDLITHIDGESVKGFPLNKSVSKMRGKIGTAVTIKIARKGSKQPLEFKLVRAIVKLESITAEVMNDVAYIKLSTFSEKSANDLRAAINKLTKQIGAKKLKGFILDLRLNSGGLLDQAVAVTDSFISSGEIVSTRGRVNRSNLYFFAKTADLTKGAPLIVLINGGSASASEIVAGALQDHKRATLLGTKSFGKGSVQTLIPLSQQDGSLRLTTALYYTPSGKSIQGAGITPDIIVEQPLPEDMKEGSFKIGESSLRGHIKGENEKKEEESGSNAYVPIDRKQDVQLATALKLLRGTMVHDAFPPGKKVTVNKAKDKVLTDKDKNNKVVAPVKEIKKTGEGSSNDAKKLPETKGTK